LKKEKKKVLEQQENLSLRETILSKEHQAQNDHLTEENMISFDAIGHLRIEIDNVKFKHEIQLAFILYENKEMSKGYENHVDTIGISIK
jgi:hypothetical protein